MSESVLLYTVDNNVCLLILNRPNKRNALNTLRARLAALNKREKPRIPTRPSRRALERRLSLKQRRSSKKTLRRKPRVDDD